MEWVTGIAIFSAGIGAGIVIHFLASNRSKEIKKLMRELHQTNKEHRELQTVVDDYFSKSNQLMVDFHTSFQNIQEHFDQGLETLGRRAALQNQSSLPSNESAGENPSEAPQMQVSTNDEADGQATETENMNVSAPRDYAPKSDKNESTLSEEYGLKQPQIQSSSQG